MEETFYKEELIKCIWNISHYSWSQVSSASFFFIYTVCQHQKRTPRKHFPSSFLFLQLTKMFNTLGFFFLTLIFSSLKVYLHPHPAGETRSGNHRVMATLRQSVTVLLWWQSGIYSVTEQKPFFEVSVCCPHFFFFLGTLLKVF